MAYTIFRAYDATQEQRHFQNVMLLLQVQKYVRPFTDLAYTFFFLTNKIPSQLHLSSYQLPP